MAAKEKRKITYDEAVDAVKSISRRLALLHLSYAKILIEELGEKRGKKLIAKTIKDYGAKIGEKTREEVEKEGLEPVPKNFGCGKSYRLPAFGMHDRIETVEVDGESRMRAYGCELAKVWKEHKENKIGRLYCYMDVAKYMSYNPNFKLIHTKTVPDGDEYCELAVRQTTEKERKDFSAKDKDWLYIDK